MDAELVPVAKMAAKVAKTDAGPVMMTTTPGRVVARSSGSGSGSGTTSGAAPTVMKPAPPKQPPTWSRLVQLVQDWRDENIRDHGHQEAWYRFVTEHGGSTKDCDPRLHTAASLIAFLSQMYEQREAKKNTDKVGTLPGEMSEESDDSSQDWGRWKAARWRQ